MARKIKAYRSLTTDDLLKRQEERPYKRQKLDDVPRNFMSRSRSNSENGDESEVEVQNNSISEAEGTDDDDDRVEEEEEEEGVDAGSSSDSGSSILRRTQKQKQRLDSDVLDNKDFLDFQFDSTQSITAPSRLGSFARLEAKEELPLPQSKTRPVVSSFSTLGISPSLTASLSAMAIHTPTEVQAACILPLLEGRDCVGNAKTGSGKTVAFALPILQKLSVDPYGIYALVLTPTRELAFQISEQFSVLGASLNIQTAVIVGGMDMIAQAIELNSRPHVVVATPGRIVDHLRSSNGEWNLSRVKFLVLDEADRLLTSTFAPELAYLFGVIPKERQTCLFTATMTPSIESLIEAPPRPGKQKPFVHRMSDVVETVETLQQFYVLVPSQVREPYLYHLLCNPPESICGLRRAPPEIIKSHKKGKSYKKKVSAKKASAEDDEIIQPPPTIIFCARARTAAYLTQLLKTLSIRSTALHSHLTQRERLNSLNLFRACVVPVLISTDVGARGLDIEEVAMVVNWDMPMEPEEYTHRVGRTARKGRGGVAVSLVTERDEERVLKIEERIKTKLVEMTMPEGKVLEKLNAVSTAKRLANMELHDSNFGKREEIHKIKRAKRSRDGD